MCRWCRGPRRRAGAGASSAPGPIGSCGGFFAEMDRHPALTVVVEHGDELEAGSERFEVLAECRDAQVVGVLELGDRSLCHVEASGQLGLAHHLGVAELVEADFLKGL